jgi:diguanylate cyclase (GGDEF)-like protein
VRDLAFRLARPILSPHESMSANHSGDRQKLQHLEEIQRLRQEVERLESENNDLQMVLWATVEHSTSIEAQLAETNQKLQAEIKERQRSEASLKSLFEVVSKQKDDLEILIQILVEHSDLIDLQWQEQILHAHHLATVDSLTQLANRRGFEQYLEQQWQILSQEKLPLSLMVCDIDYFKQYNDTYGHLAGDNCLQKIARVLDRSFDPSRCLAARYGGEEFAAVLPRTDVREAMKIVQLFQSEVRNSQIPHSGSPSDRYVTLSIGLTGLIPTQAISPLMLFDEADRLLYQAKQRGRNQIVCKVLE